jgi:hypothetical protein
VRDRTRLDAAKSPIKAITAFGQPVQSPAARFCARESRFVPTDSGYSGKNATSLARGTKIAQ